MVTQFSSSTSAAADTDIAHTRVTGGGGIQLHVVETGADLPQKARVVEAHRVIQQLFADVSPNSPVPVGEPHARAYARGSCSFPLPPLPLH